MLTRIGGAGRVILGAVLAASLGAVVAFAQDHPEHPKAKPAASKPSVSKEAIGTAIRDWVGKDSKLKGGFFLVYDGTAKKPLVLTMQKVHDDKLAQVGEGTYFACADFKAEDGTVYDLDVFMKGDSAKDLDTTEVTIHKENGKERYGWKEEGGVWKRVPAK